jgi:hypothetical protein
MIAAGVGYALAQNVQTYLQWNHVFGSGSGSNNRGATIDSFFVGLKYSFGKKGSDVAAAPVATTKATKAKKNA